MNKKDFDEIAKMIKEHPSGESLSNNKKKLANKLADYFETTEHIEASYDGILISRKVFNRKEFLKLCGVEE